MKHLLQKLTQAARDRQLPYLLVGGHAVILYGVPRFTRDIDFLITDRWRDGWQQLMESHGYRLLHRVHAFDQYESAMSTPSPGVDFMLVDEPVWDKLSADSRSLALTGSFTVMVPDPLHLIAMKLRAAQGPHRRKDARDFDDVRQLIRACRINLEDPVTKAIFEKYGTSGQWDQLTNKS